MKIIQKHAQNLRIYYYDLNNPIKEEPIKKYHMGKATILDFIRSYFYGNTKLNFMRWLVRKDDYFIIRDRNTIIAWARICYKSTKEVELGSKEASLISGFTVKAYRNRGMHTALIKQMMIYLKNKGFKRCIVWAEENNMASRAVIEKNQFTLVSSPPKNIDVPLGE